MWNTAPIDTECTTGSEPTQTKITEELGGGVEVVHVHMVASTFDGVRDNSMCHPMVSGPQ